MRKLNQILALTSASVLAAFVAASPALADGEPSYAAPAADEGRKFEWSVTFAGTSDYVFHGFSYNDEDPAFQPA